MLSAVFGLPCRSDNVMENKGHAHLFYMHFQNPKKISTGRAPQAGWDSFWSTKGTEYLGQALISRNSINNDVKFYSSSRLTENFHSKTKERA